MGKSSSVPVSTFQEACKPLSAPRMKPLLEQLDKIARQQSFGSGRDSHEAAFVDGQRQLANRILQAVRANNG